MSEYTISDVIRRLGNVSRMPSMLGCKELPRPIFWGEEVRALNNPYKAVVGKLGAYKAGGTESAGTVGDAAEPVVPHTNIALTTSANEKHTTDEAAQLFNALEHSGYKLCGYGYSESRRNVRELVEEYRPELVVIQDPREWLGLTAGRGQNPDMSFSELEYLNRSRLGNYLFKVGVVKDAQSNHDLHTNLANQAGVHAWVCYYHPRIVKHVAPYLRERDLIRTYHTLDFYALPKEWRKTLLSCVDVKELSVTGSLMPELNTVTHGAYTNHPSSFPPEKRLGCVVSGAVSGAYPLRQRIIQAINDGTLRNVGYMRHPGYQKERCHTPDYLKMLCSFEVSICTASKYGYALRKIIESTACGCKVITDLPVDEVMPEIDGNLIRVRPDVTVEELKGVIKQAVDTYDRVLQTRYALKAVAYYDYRNIGASLSNLISEHASRYSDY